MTELVAPFDVVLVWTGGPYTVSFAALWLLLLIALATD